MNKKYLLFDIGGTNTRLALFRQGAKSFDEPIIYKTPKKFSDGMKKLKTMATQVCGSKIAGAAGGIAGPMDSTKAKLVNPPNLKGWGGKNFKSTLSKIINAPVTVDNDTAVVGLGEAVAGAGKGFPIVVYVTVSTGVNGVRVVNGKIDPSYLGFEMGKQIMDEQGRNLEWYVSGNSLKKRYGKIPHEIKDKKIWANVIKHLAVGLNNTILHWSPHVVVLGGGVMNEMTMPPIAKELKKILKIYPKLPAIKRSKLGDFGGLHGARTLIRQIKK
ncbi:MAG: ROK family protein [bacterium]|nr:ROK family protein [bacterium]